MGSFPVNCCISGLPIDCGDKIRILMLTQCPFYIPGKDAVEMNGIWFPRTFPLRAVYADSANAKKVEKGLMRDTWLEGLQLDLVERSVGKNEVHDVPTNKKMPFEKLLDALWEGRVLVKFPVEPFRAEIARLRKVARRFEKGLSWPPEQKPLKREKSLPIGLGMIREDVWQELLGITLHLADERVLTSTKRREETRKTFVAGRPVAGNLQPFTVSLGEHVNLLRRKLTIAGKAFPRGILNDISDFHFIQNVLAVCRYEWRLSSSAGPQNPNWRTHHQYAEAIHRIAASHIKR